MRATSAAVVGDQLVGVQVTENLAELDHSNRNYNSKTSSNHTLIINYVCQHQNLHQQAQVQNTRRVQLLCGRLLSHSLLLRPGLNKTLELPLGFETEQNKGSSG